MQEIQFLEFMDGSNVPKVSQMIAVVLIEVQKGMWLAMNVLGPMQGLYLYEFSRHQGLLCLMPLKGERMKLYGLIHEPECWYSGY